MPMMANAAPLKIAVLESSEKPGCKASTETMLKAVASSPGPRPPIPAEIKTAGTK